MIKNTALSIFSLSLFALSACSDDTQQFSEHHRKIDSPIEGVWQIADYDACRKDIKDKTIIITPEQIELINETTEHKTLLLEKMQRLKSSRLVMLSGTLNINETSNQQILVYDDMGDKLKFKGFLIDNKLLSIKEILENYNADGKAKSNIALLNFNYCKKS